LIHPARWPRGRYSDPGLGLYRCTGSVTVDSGNRYTTSLIPSATYDIVYQCTGTFFHSKEKRKEKERRGEVGSEPVQPLHGLKSFVYLDL
jgi:hypothetical protein